MDLYMYYLHNENIQFTSELDKDQLKSQARDETISNDSDCESEDCIGPNESIVPREQGLNYENRQHIGPIKKADSSHAIKRNQDIFEKQQKLKEEAKIALVLGAKMARMQVEIERQTKKSSSIYQLVGIDIHDDKLISIDVLNEMTNVQLQAIINDLHYQIESHNDELVNLLIERDTLSMEQDSILVDIEDLTQRLREHETLSSKQSINNKLNVSTDDSKIIEKTMSKRSIFQHFFGKTKSH